MARKPKPLAKVDPCPLDSGCWTPLADVWAKIQAEDADPHIRLLDMFLGLNDGRVKCRLCRTEGKRGRMIEPIGFLTEWEEANPVHGPNEEWLELQTVCGFLRPASSGVFFSAWWPELEDLLWPACGAAQPELVAAQTKRGQKAKTKWRLAVTAEFCRLALAGEDIPGAPHFIKRCGEDDLYPDDSDTRELIRALRALLI